MAAPSPVFEECNEVQRVELLAPRKVRLDIAAPAPLYVALLAFFLSGSADSSTSDVSIVLLGCLAVAHALLLLAPHWSVKARALLHFARTAEIGAATTALLVLPIPGTTAFPEIVPLLTTPSTTTTTTARFLYRKRIYNLGGEAAAGSGRAFSLQEYPVGGSIRSFRAYRGLESAEALAGASGRFGLNAFDIPLPTFWDLYREQLVAPMFVFQVFCMLLYMLDEYWYFSVFTLAMLLLIENMQVKQRLKNLTELRGMRQTEYDIHAYRASRWARVKTSELVPGDVISVTRPKSPGLVVPCDLLILNGACIVNEALLTGEAIPLAKESIEEVEDPEAALADLPSPKLHILYGGTEVVQVTPPPKDTPGLRAPDGGCTCVVLRTGFATEQGNLMRTILASAGKVNADTRESLVFIVFLLAFALSASWYVWQHGVTTGRKKSKLAVECLLIITSVVPPELPIQLSLAITHSLQALQRTAITCTEPFRIPAAGKIDVVCFDKTGTLTRDQVVFKGVAGINPADTTDFVRAEVLNEAAPAAARALAACNSLVNLDGALIGDPLEVAVLEAAGWSLTRNDVVIPDSGPRQAVKILHRFHFSSELKRMSTVASVEADGGVSVVAFTKGAPEVMEGMFTDAPASYAATHRYFARKGARVLALGYRPLVPKGSSIDTKALQREDVERGLTFAGFVLLTSPLKQDSKKAVGVLMDSLHHVVMITGDSALTACHVAERVKLSCKSHIVLTGGAKGWEWMGTDDVHAASFSPKRADMKKLFKDYDMCLTGESIAYLEKEGLMDQVVPFCRVFARVSPDQKAAIVATFNRVGSTTLMCGDGTNDVKALKRAHVGLALTQSPRQDGVDSKEEDKPKPAATTTAQAPSSTAASGASRMVAGKRRAVAPPRPGLQQLQQQQQPSFQDLMEDEVPHLGDASIAAPFTSKRSGVSSVCQIIRQGRCTLATTSQMLKILALNCLINAYSFSALYLDGVKLSDTQMTTQGLGIAFCMFMISKTKPLEKLAADRPYASTINPYMFGSILGQFAVHLYCLMHVVTAAKQIAPLPAFDPDNEEHRKFAPSMLNSAVFLMMIPMQVSTIAINYRGRPFMEGLLENRPLIYALGGMLAVVLSAVLFESQELFDMFELVAMPSDFRTLVATMIGVDVLAAFAVDLVCGLVFPRPRSNNIATLAK